MTNFFSSLSPVLWSLAVFSSLSVGSLFSLAERDRQKQGSKKKSCRFCVDFFLLISLLSQCHSSRWCRGLEMSRASLSSMSFFPLLCFDLMLVSLFCFCFPLNWTSSDNPAFPFQSKRERESKECHDLFLLFCRLFAHLKGPPHPKWGWMNTKSRFYAQVIPFPCFFLCFYSHLPSHSLSLLFLLLSWYHVRRMLE